MSYQPILACPEGHLIDQDNVYVTPLTKTPVCRTCHETQKVHRILGAVTA